jgi:hypothetical protein
MLPLSLMFCGRLFHSLGAAHEKDFPEISLRSLNMHILYTILKARASSFTQISYEQLKISRKTKRNENLQYI